MTTDVATIEYYVNRELKPLLEQLRGAANGMRTVIADQFGADPTGKSGSSAAIARARDFLAGNGGGTILFHPGTYVIDLPLVFGENIFLQGQGFLSVLSLRLNAATDGLTWDVGHQYGAGGGLRDIKVHADSPALVRDCVSVRSWAKWNSSNAIIEGAGRYGLLHADGIGGTMVGVEMRSNVSAGLWIGTLIGSVPTTLRFLGCDFQNTGNGPGAVVDSGIGLQFTGCFFDSNGSDTSAGSPDGHGMIINQGVVSCHGCYFENNARYEIVAGVTGGTFLHLSNPTIVSGGYKTHGQAGVHGLAFLNGGGWYGGDCSAGGLGQSLTLDAGATNFAFVGVKIGTPLQRPTYNGLFANLHSYPGFIFYMDPATGNPTCSGLRALITDLDVGANFSVDDTGSGRSGFGIPGNTAARKVHIRGAATNDGLQVDAPAGAGNRAAAILGTVGHMNAGLAGVENAASNGTHLDLLSGLDAAGGSRGARLSDTGSLICGSGTQLAVGATKGFFYLPTIAGAPVGVPETQAAASAACYDPATDTIWVYNGAWNAH